MEEMSYTEGWDVLKGFKPADEVTRLKAKLAVAMHMLEQYQISIREEEWGELDKKGFCQGRYFKCDSELLGLTTFARH